MSERKKGGFKALGARIRAAYEQEKARDTRFHRATAKTRNFAQNSRLRLKEYGRVARKYQGHFDNFRNDPSKFTKTMTVQAKQAMGERSPFARKKGIRTE
jgi:hypothetical protein